MPVFERHRRFFQYIIKTNHASPGLLWRRLGFCSVYSDASVVDLVQNEGEYVVFIAERHALFAACAFRAELARSHGNPGFLFQVDGRHV